MEEITDKRAEEIASGSSASENNSISTLLDESSSVQKTSEDDGGFCEENKAQSTAKYPFTWLDVVMIVASKTLLN